MGSYIGTVPGWLTLLALLGAAWVMWRGGSPQAIGGLQSANRELAKQLRDAHDKIHTLETQVRALEQKTDLTEALAPLLAWAQQHEVASEKRHESLLLILNLIAEMYGKERNGS